MAIVIKIYVVLAVHFVAVVIMYHCSSLVNRILQWIWKIKIDITPLRLKSVISVMPIRDAYYLGNGLIIILKSTRMFSLINIM